MNAGIGQVKTDEDTGVHEAHCSKCVWKFSSGIDGKAAKELVEHNQEEHK